jgi:uncharacterized membrane protein
LRYGVVLFFSGVAYEILQSLIIADQGEGSRLAAAVGSDLKGKISPVRHAVAIAAAFVHQWISDAIYVAVALMWLVPDRRIENQIAEQGR